jgi:hypothetical protein
MKNSQLVFILLLNAFSIQAQQIVSTAGNYQANTSGSLSWTLGECLIDTYNDGNVVVNQGFQQSKLIITDIHELPGNSLEISAYPNPTEDIVTLKVTTGAGQGCRYQLYDLYGKLLNEQKLTSNETKISFMNLASGTYLLKLLNEDQVLKILKINKQ